MYSPRLLKLNFKHTFFIISFNVVTQYYWKNCIEHIKWNSTKHCVCFCVMLLARREQVLTHHGPRVSMCILIFEQRTRHGAALWIGSCSASCSSHSPLSALISALIWQNSDWCVPVGKGLRYTWCSRCATHIHLPLKQFNGALPLMELQRLNPS